MSETGNMADHVFLSWKAELGRIVDPGRHGILISCLANGCIRRGWVNRAGSRLAAYACLALSMSLVGSYIALTRPLVAALPVFRDARRTLRVEGKIVSAGQLQSKRVIRTE